MVNVFDVDFATKHGVNEAIIYEYVKYGECSTVNGLKKKLTYLGDNQIRRALQHLVDKGFLKTEINENNKFDRTIHYYKNKSKGKIEED